MYDVRQRRRGLKAKKALVLATLAQALAWVSFSACEGCAEQACTTEGDCPPDALCLNGACTGAALADDGEAPGAASSGGDAGASVSADAGSGGTSGNPSAGGGTAGPGDAGGATPGPDGTIDGPVDGCEPRGERCSFEDDDCDGVVNNGLDCTFIASSADALWRVDPFAATIDLLREVDLPNNDAILDIDMAPDGLVYATGGRRLYRLDESGPIEVFGPASGAASPVPFNPNGLAIGDDGTIYISNRDALVGSKVVSTSSLNDPPAYLNALAPYHSAGDCVIDKGSLLVSAVELDESGAVIGADRLIRVPFDEGDPIRIGSLAFARVYGLSSSFGLLFGVTEEGDVLWIDRDTGQSTLLFETDVAFSGAANAR